MRFDIISATRDGYWTVWEERAYLLRLAAIPFLIKIICFFLAFSFEIYPGTFAYPLVILPASFAEGWMIAQFLRMVLTGERWPVKIEGSVEDHFDWLMMRARAILAAILTYALISMAHGGLLVGLVHLNNLSEQEITAGSANPVALLAGFAVLGLGLWAFRLLWLHVPMILLVPLSAYLKSLKGLMPSIYMLATWLLCAVPVYFIVLFLSRLLMGPYSADVSDGPKPLSFVTIILGLAAELITVVIASTAMASLCQDLLRSYGAKPFFDKYHSKSK